MLITRVLHVMSCCCYHKGTYFQANHNSSPPSSLIGGLLLLPQRYVFSSKSQPRNRHKYATSCCCCYHKGTYFQANHNAIWLIALINLLLLLPQRYVFSSKSQRNICVSSAFSGCCCYHKGTYFQANHNIL